MKPLLFLCLTSLPALAGERWVELRCSRSVNFTNYFLPAGRVAEIKVYDAAAKALSYTLPRPEGTINQFPISRDLTSGNFVMGPGALHLAWNGPLAEGLDLYVVLLREFDAEPAAPAVNVRLEASTNLPAFKPAATFFRATSE
jgi:hypothetical protein